MRFKQLSILLVFLLISPLFINCILIAKAQTAQAAPDFYLGVDVAFASVAQTEQLIDNVSSYTNFFVIGCAQKIGINSYGGGIYNETSLSIISRYAYNKGLNFIVYSDDPSYPSKQWLENATKNFGSSFMGIYYFDEPGGRTLDQAPYPDYPVIISANNFTDAADKYNETLSSWLRGPTLGITRNFDSPTEYQLFTSDYGLYWYDYGARYNTVFTEFGVNSGRENYSRQLSIALCRGAANAFNQNWGVMITWAYSKAPYMENATDLMSDMRLAYNNGAKYIVVFDTNANWTENVLSPQQQEAIKQFWQYAQANPRTVSQPSDRTAYVLPQDFGFGFRDPNDTIFGLWNANWNGAASLTFVADISMCVVTFLQMLGPNLDIIYPVSNGTIEQLGYKNVIFWNDTTIVPNMPSMPMASHAGGTYKTPSFIPFVRNIINSHNAIEIELYTIGVAAIVGVGVFGATLTIRRRRLNA
ncbi:MAG: hypothetical protein ABSF44_14005 [Candidatus Bathyarchaeia archaeon]